MTVVESRPGVKKITPVEQLRRSLKKLPPYCEYSGKPCQGTDSTTCLSQHVVFQDKHGAYESPKDLTVKNRMTGPFWPRERWEQRMANTKRLLEGNWCPGEETILAQISQTTIEKEAKGELLDIPDPLDVYETNWLSKQTQGIPVGTLPQLQMEDRK